MTRLPRGSGWGWRNMLHRAAGSWRKTVQQLETRAKDFDNMIKTLAVDLEMKLWRIAN